MEETKTRAWKMMSVVKGLIISYLITGAALLILSFVLLKMQLNQESIDVGITIIYVLSCLAGGFFVGKVTGQQKFFWGMILGLTYFLLLLILSAFSQKGLNSSWKEILTSAVICISSGMLGGMLS